MSEIYEMLMQETTEEVKPLLTNRSRLSEEGVRESLTAYLRTPSWMIVRVPLLVMAGVGASILIRGIHPGMEKHIVLSGAVVIGCSVAMYLYRFVMYPSRKAREVIMKRQETLKTKDIATEYRFFDENIICLTNGEVTSEIAYDDIRKIYRTQHYIVLVTFRRKMLMLTPNGFMDDQEEDFTRLMKEKCPMALPKKDTD